MRDNERVYSSFVSIYFYSVTVLIELLRMAWNKCACFLGTFSINTLIKRIDVVVIRRISIHIWRVVKNICKLVILHFSIDRIAHVGIVIKLKLLAHQNIKYRKKLLYVQLFTLLFIWCHHCSYVKVITTTS